MIAIAPILTDVGRSMIIRAMGGETITFTKFVLGDGTPVGEVTAMTRVVSPKLNVGIDGKDTSNPGYIQLTGQFSTSTMTENFKWRELGIMATITGTGGTSSEQLYAYCNDGDNSGSLVKSDAVISVVTINVVVAIGNAANVEVIISEYHDPMLYDHIYNYNNPHNTTKAQVGLSEVENFSVNNMPPTYSEANIPNDVTDLVPSEEQASAETFQTIMGKLYRAVNSLKNHLTNFNNPHKVTYAQAGAAAANHTHPYVKLAGDTMQGRLIGQGNTGYTAEQMRNIIIGKEGDIGSPGTNVSNKYKNGTLIIYTD